MKAFVLYRNVPGRLSQRKMLVLVNGNKFKIDRQQHNSTSNFVSANSLIAKFVRYDASSIESLFLNASDQIWYIHLLKELGTFVPSALSPPFFWAFSENLNFKDKDGPKFASPSILSILNSMYLHLLLPLPRQFHYINQIFHSRSRNILLQNLT